MKPVPAWQIRRIRLMDEASDSIRIILARPTVGGKSLGKSEARMQLIRIIARLAHEDRWDRDNEVNEAFEMMETYRNKGWIDGDIQEEFERFVAVAEMISGDANRRVEESIK